jgi:hypothetical protein
VADLPKSGDSRSSSLALVLPNIESTALAMPPDDILGAGDNESDVINEHTTVTKLDNGNDVASTDSSSSASEIGRAVLEAGEVLVEKILTKNPSPPQLSNMYDEHSEPESDLDSDEGDRNDDKNVRTDLVSGTVVEVPTPVSDFDQSYRLSNDQTLMMSRVVSSAKRVESREIDSKVYASSVSIDESTRLSNVVAVARNSDSSSAEEQEVVTVSKVTSTSTSTKLSVVKSETTSQLGLLTSNTENAVVSGSEHSVDVMHQTSSSEENRIKIQVPQYYGV